MNEETDTEVLRMRRQIEEWREWANSVRGLIEDSGEVTVGPEAAKHWEALRRRLGDDTATTLSSGLEEDEGSVSSVEAGDVVHNGELELRLMVDGHKGSCWISREFWEAIGNKAKWMLIESLERLQVEALQTKAAQIGLTRLLGPDQATEPWTWARIRQEVEQTVGSLDQELLAHDRLEEQIDEIASALGDETEWSNLNDRGVNALELAEGHVRELDRAARMLLCEVTEVGVRVEVMLHRLLACAVTLDLLLAALPRCEEPDCSNIATRWIAGEAWCCDGHGYKELRQQEALWADIVRAHAKGEISLYG